MRQSKTIMTIGNDERVPRLNHRNGGFFFLLGGRDEVDAPREFYYDETAKTLTIHVEPGQDPNAMDIEFQRRLHILKVKNVKHVNLIDLETTGGPIVLEQCENMTLRDQGDMAGAYRRRRYHASSRWPRDSPSSSPHVTLRT